MSQACVGDNHWLDDHSRPTAQGCRTLKNAQGDEMEINVFSGGIKLTLHDGRIVTVIMDNLEDTLEQYNVSAFGWHNVRQLWLVGKEG